MSLWTPVDGGYTTVGVTGRILTATFTRPSDTSAYAQYDSVCNSTSAPTILTFADAARAAGGSGWITKAQVETDQATCTAQFRLRLFTRSVALANDNAQYPTAFANAPYCVGFIDFPAMTTEGTGSGSATALWTGAPLLYVLEDTSLYSPGLITRAAAGWTPASGQNFRIKLGVELN